MVMQRLRLHAPSSGGPSLIPGQGTRSHMQQLRVPLPQLKIPCAATETWCSQINKQINTVLKRSLHDCFRKRWCSPTAGHLCSLHVWTDVCKGGLWSSWRWGWIFNSLRRPPDGHGNVYLTNGHETWWHVYLINYQGITNLVLKQCQAQSKHSIDICWLVEWNQDCNEISVNINWKKIKKSDNIEFWRRYTATGSLHTLLVSKSNSKSIWHYLVKLETFISTTQNSTPRYVQDKFLHMYTWGHV